jgi:hypothetical protein
VVTSPGYQHLTLSVSSSDGASRILILEVCIGRWLGAASYAAVGSFDLAPSEIATRLQRSGLGANESLFAGSSGISV